MKILILGGSTDPALVKPLIDAISSRLPEITIAYSNAAAADAHNVLERYLDAEDARYFEELAEAVSWGPQMPAFDDRLPRADGCRRLGKGDRIRRKQQRGW
jgi:hypothetical protein